MYKRQAIRDALDSYGAKDNKHYELSVAMSASPKMMAAIEYEKVLKIVDFANMMTYDSVSYTHLCLKVRTTAEVSFLQKEFWILLRSLYSQIYLIKNLQILQ